MSDPAAPRVEQLRMVWPKHSRRRPPAYAVPEGYALRTFQPGDESGYGALMRSAGFDFWVDANTTKALKSVLPHGLVFLVDEGTRALVATAAANHRGPGTGELGWVACSPAHRGKGLGLVVCAAAVQCFLRAGYGEIYLKSDDFRLPALKLYLHLGFVPLLYALDMKARWEAVFRQLGIDFETTPCEVASASVG